MHFIYMYSTYIVFLASIIEERNVQKIIEFLIEQAVNLDCSCTIVVRIIFLEFDFTEYLSASCENMHTVGYMCAWRLCTAPDERHRSDV